MYTFCFENVSKGSDTVVTSDIVFGKFVFWLVLLRKQNKLYEIIKTK